MSDIIEQLKAKDLVLSHAHVGSRATCDPAPKDTDEDHIVLIRHGKMQDAIGVINEAGFYLDNPQFHYRPEEGVFNSWRLNEVNLIVTEGVEFYRRFLAASTVAKAFNLLSKQDRVKLFQAVLYGNGWDEFSHTGEIAA